MGQFYIGLMSGTSLDGVDLAIVDFDTLKPTLISTHFTKYPNKLLTPLKNACRQSSIHFDELGRLDAELGVFYANCVQQALSNASLNSHDITAIGSHGQTIQHSPNSQPSYTLQIGDANRITQNTGISVVADFRRRDIAAGGQGAPLVPAFHQAIFQSSIENLAVVNIGGISNVTFLPANCSEAIIGFDCGPGNTLMDQWCQQYFDRPYDESGDLSRAGNVSTDLLNNLLRDPYFSQGYPKSTGPEYFNLNWLKNHLERNPTSTEDTLSTLCELTASCIAQSIQQLPSVNKTLICGGGVHNSHLQARLETLLNSPVTTTATYGVDPDIVEAMAFAWLAKQTIEGRTGNIPSVTGAKQTVVLGAIYSA
ncbi:MAG: anhydro-N-acetylmuramic acid kinase [Cycloclasticus sp. symbiont of Bathymodiolus heckerae]|nr:MAG: anhydro-N-acetylmuramic acid kinase [Cycloclasticus sp. symbiont of Bathymodiolus heckerae]